MSSLCSQTGWVEFTPVTDDHATPFTLAVIALILTEQHDLVPVVLYKGIPRSVHQVLNLLKSHHSWVMRT